MWDIYSICLCLNIVFSWDAASMVMFCVFCITALSDTVIWVKEKLRGKGLDFWFLRCLGLFRCNIFGWRGMLTIMLNAVEWELYFQFVAEYEFCWSVYVSLAVGVWGKVLLLCSLAFVLSDHCTCNTSCTMIIYLKAEQMNTIFKVK